MIFGEVLEGFSFLSAKFSPKNRGFSLKYSFQK
jgi:hypothetical protein